MFPLHLTFVPAVLINDIADLPTSLALVLDDYQVITAQPIHQALAFLPDHLPQNMHLVIITCPVSLARPGSNE